MVYLYPKRDLRAFPGTIQGTDEYAVERFINHFKDCFYLVEGMIVTQFNNNSTRDMNFSVADSSILK